MDERTLRYYESHAAEVGALYESGPGDLEAYFPLAFRPGARVVDVGAGSGRHLATLMRDGHEVYGVEPSEGLRAFSMEAHPELAGRMRAGTLPAELPGDLPGPFDGVLCSAVFQHIPRPQLLDSVFALRALLVDRGRLLLSVPAARPGLDEASRDQTGRLYNMVLADELELLFQRAGFRSIGRWETGDSLGRAGVRWTALVFELASSTGYR